MAIRKVAIFGANGTLGPEILKALLAEKTYEITVLQRTSSKSKNPDSVQVKHFPDDPSLDDLSNVLQGQDAVIVSFITGADYQIKIADAAARAGVRRIIPADFGSCDSSSERALKLLPLYRNKTKVREHLQQLATKSDLTWTSLICGHFFDQGLTCNLLQMDLKAKKAGLFDGGEIKASLTNLSTIGKAVVGIFQHEEETKNRMLYIQSFCLTQNQVLKALEQATGQDWEVTHYDSEEFIKEMKAEMDRNPDNKEAHENLVSAEGLVDGNWEGKKDFANPLLGLEEEDLDSVIQRVLKEAL